MRRFNRDILPGSRERDSGATNDEPSVHRAGGTRPNEIVLDPANSDPQQMSSFVNAVMSELQRRDERIADLERSLAERTAELERMIAEAKTAPVGGTPQQVGADVTAILQAAESAAERMRHQAELDNERLRARVLTVVDEIRRAQSSLGDMATALARSVTDDSPR